TTAAISSRPRPRRCGRSSSTTHAASGATSTAAEEPDVDVLALDAALHRLAEHDTLKARLVELRYFAGLTGDQAAAGLGTPARAAGRSWVYTRAWLRRELGFGVEP